MTQMKTHPLLFKAPMIQALLAGRKTQTRRFVKIKGHRKISEFGRSNTKGYDWHFRDAQMRWHDLTDQELKERLIYAIGDFAWVKETWRPKEVTQPWDLEVIYNADGESRIIKDGEFGDNDWTMPKAAEKGNVSSLFMPRWASRLTLKITDVRVERLQDISEQDAIAEGLAQLSKDGETFKFGIPDADGLPGNDDCGWHWQDWDLSPQRSYQRLWNQINGADAWNENPFVVALTFEVIKQNIDQYLSEAA